MIQNVLKEADVNRLFTIKAQQPCLPFDLNKLPKVSCENPLAKQAYQNIINRFRRWNEFDCRLRNNTNQAATKRCHRILDTIYTEIQLMKNSTNVRQQVTMIKLSQMMIAFNATSKTEREWIPNVQPPSEVERPVHEKSPFYIRSRFANLSNNHTLFRLASLQANCQGSIDKKSSRRMRIYGKGKRLCENIQRDGSSKKLFWDWMLKEKCQQLHVMTDCQWNKIKSKKSYTKIAVSEYVKGAQTKRPAVGEATLKERGFLERGI